MASALIVDRALDMDDGGKVTGPDEQCVASVVVKGLVDLAMKVGQHGTNHYIGIHNRRGEHFRLDAVLLSGRRSPSDLP